MIFEELVLEQRQRALERIDPARVALVEAELARRRGGLRRALADALVRWGVRLDRDAGERVVVRREAPAPAARIWL